MEKFELGSIRTKLEEAITAGCVIVDLEDTSLAYFYVADTEMWYELQPANNIVDGEIGNDSYMLQLVLNCNSIAIFSSFKEYFNWYVNETA